jgi:allophanate hydrolase subunit 1
MGVGVGCGIIASMLLPAWHGTARHEERTHHTHQSGTMAGKLKGQMPAHTPTGWRML